MDVFTTKSGRVRGRRAARDRGIVVVRGLPYAAPPFGARRFREPRPAEPWDGVRDCTAFVPVAAELPGAPSRSPGDEDILTVNVWTHADGPGDLPVLVWIHGGAYVFGSSAQPDFDGTALAGRGARRRHPQQPPRLQGFGYVPERLDATCGVRPDCRCWHPEAHRRPPCRVPESRTCRVIGPGAHG